MNLNRGTFDLQATNFKHFLRDAREEIDIPQPQSFLLDKSKISSKSYGMIKGYSANSHAGPINTYN